MSNLIQNRILLIEDDCDTRANLCDILELDAYAVDAVGSFAEATSPRNWSQYFAILLDRRLPDGTAEEFLPALRGLAPEASVIVVTGHADLHATIAALREGVEDFIIKPLDAEQLRSSLSRIQRLREAREAARQAERLAAVGEMVATVVHESRNFLQRISASAEMLEMDLADNPSAMREVAKIQTAGTGLLRLFEQIRLYASPIQLARTTCNLRDIWQQAWGDLAKNREGRDVKLEELVRGGEPVVSVDGFRLQQVFRNLFENSLSACVDPTRISVNLEVHGATFAINVLDNGPGLSEGQEVKVFQPFYTTKPKGTGLGMSIVKRIVEAHAGTIQAIRPSRGGAEFQIHLPR